MNRSTMDHDDHDDSNILNIHEMSSIESLIKLNQAEYDDKIHQKILNTYKKAVEQSLFLFKENIEHKEAVRKEKEDITNMEEARRKKKQSFNIKLRGNNIQMLTNQVFQATSNNSIDSRSSSCSSSSSSSSSRSDSSRSISTTIPINPQSQVTIDWSEIEPSQLREVRRRIIEEGAETRRTVDRNSKRARSILKEAVDRYRDIVLIDQYDIYGIKSNKITAEQQQLLATNPEDTMMGHLYSRED
jgi:hypothetical protein